MRIRWAIMSARQFVSDLFQTPAATRMQFSLRSVMMAIVVAGCLFSALRIVPHIVIFSSGVILAGLSVFLIIRLRRWEASRILRSLVYASAIVAWSFLYVVSIGPVAALNEFGFAMFDTVYAPVIWLHDATSLKEPLNKYAELWGWQ